MATVGGFSRHKNLIELTQSDITGKSPAVRQAEARENLGISADVAELNAAAAFVADVTATAAEVNAAADGSTNTVVVAAGGGAITLPTGGGTVIVPLLTSNATATLPVPTVGAKYSFVFVGTAADAEDTIITSAATSFFVGGLTRSEWRR